MSLPRNAWGAPMGLAPQAEEALAVAQERGRPMGLSPPSASKTTSMVYDEETQHGLLGTDLVSRKARSIDKAIDVGLLDGEVGPW